MLNSRRILVAILLLLVPACIVSAQTESLDSLIFRPSAQLDSTLARRGLFASMPSNVKVHQGQSIVKAYLDILDRNSGENRFMGFRIKLYSDSSQSARAESEQVMRNFRSWFPTISVYRSFSSPYFKVLAGDFRTRVDAERVLRVIRPSFPTATIVKDRMEFPSLDDDLPSLPDSLNIRVLNL